MKLNMLKVNGALSRMKKWFLYIICSVISALLSGSITYLYFAHKLNECFTESVWFGNYVSEGDSFHQSVSISKIQVGTHDLAAYMSVGTDSGCVGEFHGAGALNEDLIIFREAEYGCAITTILNSETRVLSVVSSNECRNLSGMRCGFDGTYFKSN